MGRRRPSAPNRHISIDSLADLSVLRDIPFDRVVFAVGNSNHHEMSRDVIPAGQPTAFDYHDFSLIQALEQLKQRPLRQFIRFSTVLLYADPQPVLPVPETAPIDPYKSRYTMSQYLAEELCKFYSRWVPVLNLRITTFYGLTECPRWDLIHQLVDQVVRSGHAEVWSTRPARDFLFIEDAVNAISMLLETDAHGTLNLGTGRMIAVGEIVGFLRNLTACTITDRDQPVTGPMQFCCDLTALRRWIDWQPRVSVEEGIRRMYTSLTSGGAVCA